MLDITSAIAGPGLLGKMIGQSGTGEDFFTRYYVDATGGGDGNDGLRPDRAWQTIAKVNAASFVASDRILFKRGEEWRETLTIPSSGTAGRPIVFGAYGSGNKPVINGANVLSTWTSYSGNTWQKTEVWSEPNHVFMDETRLTQGADRDSLNDHEWAWLANVLYVRDESGDPDGTGVVIEAPYRYWCIDQNEKSNIVFADLNLNKPNGAGLLVDGSCTEIRVNNVIVDQFFDVGIHVDNSGSPGDSSNVVIDNCTVFDGFERGIHLNAVGDGCVVRRCTVYDVVYVTTAQGIDFDGYPGVISEAIVENNRVYDIDSGGSDGIGIQLENCDSTPIIRNNVVSGCSFAGISIIAYDAHDAVPDLRGVAMDGQIYNNLVYESNIGLTIYFTAGWDIFHNTFADGIGDDTGLLVWYESGRASDVANLDWRNNLVYGCAKGMELRYDVDALNTHDYNSYGAGVFNVLSPFVSRNLTQFQTATSQEANSITDNPLFEDAPNDDYHIGVSTTGVDVSIATDLDGVTRADPPDIGAYEYTG